MIRHFSRIGSMFYHSGTHHAYQLKCTEQKQERMKMNRLNSARKKINRRKYELKLKHQIEFARKDLRHVYEFIWTWRWKEKMEKREDLCGWRTWLMNTPLEVWMLQISVNCRHLRNQGTQDKTRKRRRQVLTSLNHQFGRVSLLQKSILLFEGPKPSFYRERTCHEAYKAYTTS